MDSGGQLFTACQFGFQRTQRAYGMRQIQIAYAAHGMRQPFEFAERGTAFEIQEHEIQMLRPVHRGERQTPALQQHGFSGTSGAGHQSMRPLTVQIEHQRLASGHADRHRKVKGFKPAAHNGAPWQACEVQQRFYRLRRRMTEVCGAVIGMICGFVGAVMAANSHCPCNSSMTIINACAIIGHAAANMVRRARNGGAPKRCFARDTADAVWTECRFESFCCDVMLPAWGNACRKRKPNQGMWF